MAKFNYTANFARLKPSSFFGDFTDCRIFFVRFYVCPKW